MDSSNILDRETDAHDNPTTLKHDSPSQQTKTGMEGNGSENYKLSTCENPKLTVTNSANFKDGAMNKIVFEGERVDNIDDAVDNKDGEVETIVLEGGRDFPATTCESHFSDTCTGLHADSDDVDDSLAGTNHTCTVVSEVQVIIHQNERHGSSYVENSNGDEANDESRHADSLSKTSKVSNKAQPRRTLSPARSKRRDTTSQDRNPSKRRKVTSSGEPSDRLNSKNVTKTTKNVTRKSTSKTAGSRSTVGNRSRSAVGSRSSSANTAKTAGSRAAAGNRSRLNYGRARSARIRGQTKPTRKPTRPRIRTWSSRTEAELTTDGVQILAKPRRVRISVIIDIEVVRKKCAAKKGPARSSEMRTIIRQWRESMDSVLHSQALMEAVCEKLETTLNC